MKKNIIVFLTGLFLIHPLFAQQAIITETVQTFKTYPFSDPDPVADPSDLFYPYFRFDGFAAKGMDKDWKVVSLENDYIKLTLRKLGGKYGERWIKLLERSLFTITMLLNSVI